MKKISVFFIITFCLFSLLFCDEIDSLYYFNPDSLEDVGYIGIVCNLAEYFEMEENIEYDLLKLKIIINMSDESKEWIYVHQNDSTNKPGTIIDSIYCYFPEPDSQNQYYRYSKTFDLSEHDQLKKLQGNFWLSGTPLMFTPANRTCSGHTYAQYITNYWYNDGPDIPVKIIFNKREKSNAIDINDISYSLSSLDVFPNPFNSSTILKFQLKQISKFCSLKIYDIKGNIVFSKKLNINNNYARITWNPEKKLSSGEYFAILKTENEVLKQKMLYLK